MSLYRWLLYLSASVIAFIKSKVKKKWKKSQLILQSTSVWIKMLFFKNEKNSLIEANNELWLVGIFMIQWTISFFLSKIHCFMHARSENKNEYCLHVICILVKRKSIITKRKKKNVNIDYALFMKNLLQFGWKSVDLLLVLASLKSAVIEMKHKIFISFFF